MPLTHGAFYEARPAAMDGSGEVSLRELVKFCLVKLECSQGCDFGRAPVDHDDLTKAA